MTKAQLQEIKEKLSKLRRGAVTEKNGWTYQLVKEKDVRDLLAQYVSEDTDSLLIDEHVDDESIYHF